MEVRFFLWVLPVMGSTKSPCRLRYSGRLIQDVEMQTGSGIYNTRFRRSASFTNCALLSLHRAGNLLDVQ